MRRMRIPRGAITVELPGAPQQRDHTCGAAVLRSVCAYYGVGPGSEAQIARDMGMTPDGSDPAHLVRALATYGLAHREVRGMSDAALCAALVARRPVIIMLQAWADRRRTYRRHWRDGHWVAVIGYDARGIYVADPMLDGPRGFVSWSALADRWHDIEGRTRRRVARYGLIVWSARARRAVREREACAVP